MNRSLFDIVLNRLDADKSLNSEEAALILAACEGVEDLNRALGEVSGSRQAQRAVREETPPSGAFLRAITVSGFRGIGPETTLQLSGGPGLTLVVGPNGSGKSSFAESVELLLTGDNKRWSDRSKIWQEGWKNLHRPDDVVLSAQVTLDGKSGPTRVERCWARNAELAKSRATFQHPGEPKRSLPELGWDQALKMYRPFLSYSELGSMLDEGPSRLYDALSSILGLEDLVSAQEILRQVRLRHQRQKKETAGRLDLVLAKLADSEDERAGTCEKALSGRRWDLAAVEAVLGGEEEASEPEAVGALRELSALEVPTVVDARSAAATVREAQRALEGVAGTGAEQDRAIVELLDSTVQLHEAHGDRECPVCGEGALDSNWRRQAEEQIRVLRERASKASAAHALAARALRCAKDLITPAPACVSRAAEFGLDSTACSRAYSNWVKGAELEDLNRLAKQIEATIGPLREAVTGLRSQAQAELDRIQSLWRPIAVELAAWLQEAKEAVKRARDIPRLKRGEEWLKSTSAEIRNERFAPIATRVAGIWELLRQQSSVDLGRVQLEGSGSRRRVELDATVDGKPGVALGVMSQGELHSLALSLFLSRATIEESPFRFVMIDDPVQSMDPARIDGLARVLRMCSQSRQVIVFTHDTRLAEAVRRLEIEATVVEVARRANSVVETRLVWSRERK